MRGASLTAFLVLIVLVIFAFMVFQDEGGAVGGARHWAAAPLTAITIVFSGGCLAVMTAGRAR